jgi:predicted permease
MARLLNLLPWRRRRLEQDLDREMRYHIDRRIDDLRRSGVSDAEARRLVALEFGGTLQVREDVRETWILGWLDDLRRDIRYGLRMLRRGPAFTVTAILSLTLGIGGAAAIFSLVNQVVLRSLPVHEPDRIVQVLWKGRMLAPTYGFGSVMSYPLCRDLQEQAQLPSMPLEGVFCRTLTTVNFSTGQQHEPVRVEVVSGTYFSVLGTSPVRGRLIDPSDDRQIGGSAVAVISHQFWQTRFSGAADVIGRRIFLDSFPMTVIGIAPESFTGMDPNAMPAVWVPATMSQHAARIDGGWNGVLNRRAAWVHTFARLKPGTTIETAEAALQPWFKAMLDQESREKFFLNAAPERRREFLASSLDLEPAPAGISMLRNLLTRPLWLLLGGSMLLLMLASLNVAGLLLARGAARTHELTTRMAIGATRARITRQLLVESLLLTLGGGVLGLIAAPLVSEALLSFMTRDGDVQVPIDTQVLIFAFLASVATGIICGLAPVMQTGRIPLMASLKQRSRSMSPGGVRVRKLLVIGQMTFALLLLIGAGLFVKTVARLHERVGFTTSNLMMITVNPSGLGYTDDNGERAMRDIDRRLRELPVIEHVAAANTPLLTGGWTAGLVTIQAGDRIVSDRAVARMRVSPDFFATLGTRFVEGRDFDQREVRAQGAPPMKVSTVIVNESFVRRYFKGRSPLGARMGIGSNVDTVTDMEIIGVVKDFSRRNLRDEEVEQAFVPFWANDSNDGTFYLRVRGGVEGAVASIRGAIAQVDPAMPVTVRTFDEQIRESLRTERMLATLSSGFGILALLLAIVGLYGVLSFVVAQRTQEIGLRLALGASPSTAMWLVVRDVMIMIAAGTAVALPIAWMLRRLVEAQLFGVRPFDAPTIAIASLILGAVALAAAMIPARRAASISPTEALRLE